MYSEMHKKIIKKMKPVRDVESVSGIQAPLQCRERKKNGFQACDPFFCYQFAFLLERV